MEINGYIRNRLQTVGNNNCINKKSKSTKTEISERIKKDERETNISGKRIKNTRK